MDGDDEEGAFDIPTVKGHVNKVCGCTEQRSATRAAHSSLPEGKRAHGRFVCPPSRAQACKALLVGANGEPVPFQHGKVHQWTSTLVENILKELAVANDAAAKNGQQKYKYVGTHAAAAPVGHARVEPAAERQRGGWRQQAARS